MSDIVIEPNMMGMDEHEEIKRVVENTLDEFTHSGYSGKSGTSGYSGKSGWSGVGVYDQGLNKADSPNFYNVGVSGKILIDGAKDNIVIGTPSATIGNLDWDNIVMGWGAAQNASLPKYTIFIGDETGYNANGTQYGVFIGQRAGVNVGASNESVVIGAGAGYNMGSGTEATYVGAYAGWGASGTGNTMIGYTTGDALTSGNYNIHLGYYAGYGQTTGNAPATDDYGVLIGYQANRSVASASKLTNYVGIGYRTLIDKSNQVKIGNSSIIETQMYGTILSYLIYNTDSDTDEIDSFTWAGGHGLLIAASVTDGTSAIWKLKGTTLEVIEVDADWTTSKDNAATYNVYFEGGALKLQNKVGNNKVVKVGFYGV